MYFIYFMYVIVTIQLSSKPHFTLDHLVWEIIYKRIGMSMF